MDMYRDKMAKNTTSGAKSGGKMKADMGFDKGSDALNHTPYSKYQDSIQARNKSTVMKNLRNLKQD